MIPAITATKLAVITAAYYPNDSYYSKLKRSCELHGLPLFPFGMGQPWIMDLLAHFTGAPEAIRALPAEYDTVMFTDAADSFVLCDEEEILRKFKRFHAPIVLAAEMGLYPWEVAGRPVHDVWDESVPHPDSHSPWAYPNGGGWIGTRADLLALLDYTREQLKSPEAQGRWIEVYCEKRFKMRLDCSCEIFQTMSHWSGEHVKFELAVATNTAKHTVPCVCHWNGRAGGIDAAWEAVYGS